MLQEVVMAVGVVAFATGSWTSPILADTTATPVDTSNDGDDCGRCTGDAGSDLEGNELWAGAARTTTGGDGTTPISTGSSYFDGCVFDQAAAGEEYVTGRSDPDDHIPLGRRGRMGNPGVC